MRSISADFQPSSATPLTCGWSAGRLSRRWSSSSTSRVQLAGRLWLSPNLEVDDAEMVGQIHWAWGYSNSHPPLYHWLVRLAHDLVRQLGRGDFGAEICAARGRLSVDLRRRPARNRQAADWRAGRCDVDLHPCDRVEDAGQADAFHPRVHCHSGHRARGGADYYARPLAGISSGWASRQQWAFWPSITMCSCWRHWPSRSSACRKSGALSAVRRCCCVR